MLRRGQDEEHPCHGGHGGERVHPRQRLAKDEPPAQDASQGADGNKEAARDRRARSLERVVEEDDARANAKKPNVGDAERVIPGEREVHAKEEGDEEREAASDEPLDRDEMMRLVIAHEARAHRR